MRTRRLLMSTLSLIYSGKVTPQPSPSPYFPSSLRRLRRHSSEEVVARLAKDFVNLSVAEFAALQRHFDASTSNTSQSVMTSAAPAASGAPLPAPPKEPETPKQVQTSFDVKLMSAPPDTKVKLIKELRAVTQMAITDAKAAIDKGGIIAKKLGKEDAEKLKELLQAHKAVVEIV